MVNHRRVFWVFSGTCVLALFLVLNGTMSSVFVVNTSSPVPFHNPTFINQETLSPINSTVIYFTHENNVFLQEPPFFTNQPIENVPLEHDTVFGHNTNSSNGYLITFGANFIRITNYLDAIEGGTFIRLDKVDIIYNASLSPNKAYVAVATGRLAAPDDKKPNSDNLLVYDIAKQVVVSVLFKNSSNIGTHLLDIQNPRWSPNGKFISFDAIDPTSTSARNIYIVDVSCIRSTNTTCKLNQVGVSLAPELRLKDIQNLQQIEQWDQADWAPDSGQLVFACGYDLCFIQSAGSNLRRFVAPNGVPVELPKWSPDGKTIVYLQERVIDASNEHVLYSYNYKSSKVDILNTQGFITDFDWLTVDDAQNWLKTPATPSPLQPLKLVALCSSSPSKIRFWRIYNYNKLNISVDYKIVNQPPSMNNSRVVPGAIGSKPGEEEIITRVVAGDNTLQIFVDNVLQDTQPSTDLQCATSTPEPPSNNTPGPRASQIPNNQ